MQSNLRQLWRSGAVFSFSVAALGSGVAIFSAIQLGFGSKLEVGSGSFPFVVGVVLAAAGLKSGISSLRRQRGMADRESKLRPGNYRRIGFMVMAYVAWLLLTPFLGYIPATFIITFIMAKTLGLEGWLRPVTLSLGVTLSLYVLFEVLFYIDLPRGILG